MKTNQIIDEMAEKITDYGFNDEYGYYFDWKDGVIPIIKASIRTLLEAFGEEIVGRDQTSIHTGHEIDDDYCIQCETFVKVHPMGIYGKNDLRAEQRLKVKEIISSITK